MLVCEAEIASSGQQTASETGYGRGIQTHPRGLRCTNWSSVVGADSRSFDSNVQNTNDRPHNYRLIRHQPEIE